MSDLRQVAQQALEALEQDNPAGRGATITALRAALAQEQPSPINQCGETCERAKLCAICAREIEQEQHDTDCHAQGVCQRSGYSIGERKPLPHDPGAGLPWSQPSPQPLTDKEILAAVGWERAEMFMKLLPNFPVDEAKQETLKNARAVERAHGIKGGNDE